MKACRGNNLRGYSAVGGCRAFTIPELMVAMSIFLFVVGAVVVANFFGIRMMGVTQPKMGASAETRQAVSLMISEISSAKIIRLGTGNLTSFTPLGPGALRKGNAVQIYPTNNMNVFVRYFQDSAQKQLKRMTNGAAAAVSVANGVTNSLVFTAENSRGDVVLTNDFNNMVIGILLQYDKLDGSGTPLGPNLYFKKYEVKTRVTRRTW
jgi:prepilin-type N-terminal cleavage/methylation domain-containing protein